MPIQYLATFGRIILGLYFLAAGASKVFGPIPLPQIEHMAANGVPAAETLFILAGACELTAGICFVIGLHTRLVAVLLALFTVIVSIVLHAFWKETGHDHFVQMMMFMKNMATAAGLLGFAGLGSGPLAVDHLYEGK